MTKAPAEHFLSSPTATVLGVDAGGTCTRALWLQADGKVLGIGHAGPGNVQNHGASVAIAEIRAAAHAAFSGLGTDLPAPLAGFAACAGIRVHRDAQPVASALDRANISPGINWQAANDTEAVLAAGVPGLPGIALIAGTGSFCVGRDAHRTTAHCGGWGWLIDDIGSAFYLGRQALRAVARARDGRGSPTLLTADLCERFSIGDPDELLGVVGAQIADPKFVAQFARYVTSRARAGDKVSKCILGRGADGLAELVRQVAGKLRWSNPPSIVIAGSTARSGTPYQPLIEAAVAAAVPGCRIVHSLLPAVAGAALRALEQAGWPVSESVISQLRVECTRLGLSP